MPRAFKELCGVCKATITCWGWGADEEYTDDPKYACAGALCDYGKREGCFSHYCKECFYKHTCGAHKGST